MTETHPDRQRRTEVVWDKARGVLASGLWTVTQGAFRYPDATFPLLAERGQGCLLYDSTGRDYVDWIMGWGPVILGYREPRVERAIVDQLRAGTLLSLLTELEVEVAMELRSTVPCAERVAFGKNGSDVLGAAVRVARAATGREGVLVHGYHGFHDWYMASHPDCFGIPDSLRSLVRAFPYNDLPALRSLFEQYGDRLAAVVMEPTNTELPQPGYLEAVRELATRYGTVLIFDEIITGFRLAAGGAQAAFSVLPDLACVGKGLANGMPLSALVGKSEIMEILSHVGYGLTFRGETLSLAAARACLEIHRTEPVAERLREIGDAVRERFSAECRSVGVDAELVGPSCRMTLRFAPAGGLAPLGLQTLFIQECLKAGLLTNGNFLPSYAHDDDAIARTGRAFEAALPVLERAVAAGRLQRFLQVPARPEFYANGALEAPDAGGTAC